MAKDDCQPCARGTCISVRSDVRRAMTRKELRAAVNELRDCMDRNWSEQDTRNILILLLSENLFDLRQFDPT